MINVFKKFSYLFLVVFIMLIVVSCLKEEKEEYLVTYLYNDITSTTLKTKNHLASNEEVLNQFRHQFLGWYLEDEPFDFKQKVNEDIVLVAKYSDDYLNLVKEMHIDLNNYNDINLWKNNKKKDLKASLKLFDDKNFQINEYQIEIRGRGNSTWDQPKKPYRISFSENTSLFGMKEAKLYVLLANYFDPSGLRNYLAHEFSKMLNLDYAFETRFVELYFNGNYQGMYLLTEQVQIYETRLDVNLNSNVDSGFLIELETDERIDDEGIEDFNWVRVDQSNFVIKYPKEKGYTEALYSAKASYIKNYLTMMTNSFTNGTYKNYIDVDQFIDFFILQEIFKNVDINFSSVFSYKDEGELLKMGPIWDFDISLGNGNYYDYSFSGFQAINHPWLKALLKDNEFKELYVNRFKEVLLNDVGNLIDLLVEKGIILENYFNDDNDLWHIFGKSYWPVTDEMASVNTYKGHIILVKDFLNNRKVWLLKNLSDL